MDCGTLLAAVRDQRFISWDHDMDLGLVVDSSTDVKLFELARILEARAFSVIGYRRTIYFNKGDAPIGITLYRYSKEKGGYVNTPLTFRRNNRFLIAMYSIFRSEMIIATGNRLRGRLKRLAFAIVDILPRWLRRSAAAIINGYVRLEAHTIFVEERFFASLSATEFYGRNYAVPNDRETYLTDRYGNWRVPQKDFDYMVDDLALTKGEAAKA